MADRKNTTSISLRKELCEKVADINARIQLEKKFRVGGVAPMINALVEMFDYKKDANELIRRVKAAKPKDGRIERHRIANEKKEKAARKKRDH